MSLPAGMIVLTPEELGALLGRVKGSVSEEDYETIAGILESFRVVCQLLADKDASLGRLRRLLFGSSTEKTKKIFQPEEPPNPEADPAPAEKDPPEKPQTKRKGHGRNGADDYPNAERIPVPHEALKHRDLCPGCRRGKIYKLDQAGRELRFFGQAMLRVVVYEPEKLRCNLCGEVFTAELPKEAGTEKYDATAGSMVALLKYGTGVPFNRLEQFQGSLETPLPASTQWDIVRTVAEKVAPAHGQLVGVAAQGETVHNDDTGMTILDLPDPPKKDNGEPGERTGVFTSGIISRVDGRDIALFYTGRKHAGENLTDLLRQRQPDLGPPIQMCDGLSRNLPKEFQTIVGNCLAHGRRKFVEVTANFPGECQHLLEELAKVYRNDEVAREGGMSAQERLQFHQAESASIMKDLHDWLKAQFDQKKVEPNSGLGKAISYMLERWDRLTLFLRKPGAPLDNNICERALKMVIRHRKNALFYKTQRGAWVGDVLMSLIHTCRLNRVNPFQYLTALQRHADKVRQKPGDWMPWNYQETLRASKGG